VVSLPPIFAILPLLLLVAPSVCHADSFGLSGTRMRRLLPVALDATSSVVLDPWCGLLGLCPVACF
jgi:hypothetical protein